MKLSRGIVSCATKFALVLALLVVVSIGHAQKEPGPKPNWENEFRIEQRERVDHQNFRHAYTVKVRDGVKETLHGKYMRYYNNDGFLAQETWFFDGRFHGTSQSWSKSSSAAKGAETYARAEFVEGVMHGVHEVHWVEEDVRKTLGIYSSGRKQGTWKYWYRSGQLEKTEEYVDDLLHGNVSRWFESGQLRYRAQYEKGLQNGEWRAWHESGQLGSLTNYVDGKKDGAWTGWHDNGLKRDEGLFEKDAEVGIWTYWHENGQKSEEGVHGGRFKVGVWKYWDEDGHLIRTTDHGEPQKGD